jgi:hypothetical protein
MPPSLPFEQKILDYFKTTPLAAARLMLSLASAEVKQRESPMTLPKAKAALKRGRPPKAAKSEASQAGVNGAAELTQQSGEPVAVENILG